MRFAPIAARFIASCIALSAVPATAQVVPRPHFSGETRGQVVDADSGLPLEGVVTVARWEWLSYTPRGFHSSARYDNTGEAVHVGEAFTDGNGRFAIARWGPKVHGSAGKMAQDSPRLLYFKGGYEPLTQGAPADNAAVRLKKSVAGPKDYATRIAAFQGGSGGSGLNWRHPDGKDAMPRMILALHREKARLGEDGTAILGAHVIAGREGKGVVFDAKSRQPVATGGIVWIAWTMRRIDGAEGTRRAVQTKSLGVEGSGAHFYVSPWRLPGPAMPGWEISPGVQPRVRIYAKGYRRSDEVRWQDPGGAITIEKLPATREALLAELRTWRRDIDAELSGVERQAALPGHGAMLWSFADQCREITPDLRAGLCFDESSEEMRQVELTRRSGAFVRENSEGTVTTRIVSSSTAPQAQAVSAGGPARRARVEGFTIEPIR